MPTLLLTLAAIATVTIGVCLALLSHHIIAAIERSEDRILGRLDKNIGGWGRALETDIRNVASKVDPTALELAARQARRDARRRRTARAA
jgi:hypothetical protein